MLSNFLWQDCNESVRKKYKCVKKNLLNVFITYYFCEV